MVLFSPWVLSSASFAALLRRCLWLCVLFGVCPSLASAQLDVRINGAPSEVAENIRLHLSKWKTLPGDNVEAIQAQVRPAVTTAMQALGYYHAEVDYQLREQQLLLTVDPGPRMRWGEPDIQVLSGGEPQAEFRAVVAAHPFRRDTAFSHASYDRFKDELLSFAFHQGYLDAELLRSQLRINVQENEAVAVLHMETKERYIVADASFSESRLAPELVESLADVPLQSWYSANLVGDIYNRLLNSGYFASVNIEVDARPPNQAYLQIQLEDVARHRVSTGVGFGTDTGPWIKLRWERMALNDRGHNFTAQAQLSSVAPELFTQYKIPWGHPQSEYVSWDNGWRRQDTEDVDTTVFTTGLSYHRLFGDSWVYSLHLDLEHETYQRGEEAERESTYVIPSVRLSRRFYFGDAIDPDFGYRYWLHLATSREGLGSDTDFHRINTGISGVATFWEKHSLVGRIEFGSIDTDAFDQVPLSQRFFTGGDQSVRGFRFESIAPRDADGNLTGGQRLNVGSVEYRYRFRPTWLAAVFVDAGRSYLESGAETFDLNGRPNLDDGTRLRRAAGVGIRWRSPVGFIAVDVATPINDEHESGVQFHLYLGTAL